MYVAADVFRENYLPTEMPGRGQQLQRLSTVLEPATANEPPDSCWEFGPSGVGKTATARYLLRDLRLNYGVDSVYVQCIGNSRWQLLQEIANAHPAVLAQNNLSTEELRDRLAVPDEPFVVVLDEIGGLEDTALLTDLARIEWLSLLCIGHDRADALDQVPDPVDSLRYTETIAFDPYGDGALFDILNARRDAGLENGVVDDDQLERIIGKAGGSARFGVQALRSAVDLGIERRHTTVQPVDIDDCFDRADERIREQQLESLSRDHHIVYEVLREHGPLRPQQIYDRYVERPTDSSSRQMVVRYRDKLEEYGLIEQVADGWRVVDATLAAPTREQRPV